MSELSTALLLLFVVVLVCLGTRDTDEARRRPAGPSGRTGANASNESVFAPLPNLIVRVDGGQRTRTDRHDLALGVGRDFASPEPDDLVWPPAASALA